MPEFYLGIEAVPNLIIVFSHDPSEKRRFLNKGAIAAEVSSQ
jgi:hypothetical protein